MIRKILCEACGQKTRPQHPEDVADGWKLRTVSLRGKKPDDHAIIIKTITGDTRADLQSLMCDHCNKQIPDGDPIVLSTQWNTNRESEPGNWEAEYSMKAANPTPTYRPVPVPPVVIPNRPVVLTLSQEQWLATLLENEFNLTRICSMYNACTEEQWVNARDGKHVGVLYALLNRAWANAPDSQSIHGIPGWHVLCDLCADVPIPEVPDPDDV